MHRTQYLLFVRATGSSGGGVSCSVTVTGASTSSPTATTACALSASASASGAQAAAAAAAAAAGGSRQKPSRRNAWGNQSYADLITQAIESAPEKRLTLAQIYDWMVQNVSYFRDKGDMNSSAGWKVCHAHCPRVFLVHTNLHLPFPHPIGTHAHTSFSLFASNPLVLSLSLDISTGTIYECTVHVQCTV